MDFNDNSFGTFSYLFCVYKSNIDVPASNLYVLLTFLAFDSGIKTKRICCSPGIFQAQYTLPFYDVFFDWGCVAARLNHGLRKVRVPDINSKSTPSRKAKSVWVIWVIPISKISCSIKITAGTIKSTRTESIPFIVNLCSWLE